VYSVLCGGSFNRELTARPANCLNLERGGDDETAVDTALT
jgi:hypothetical protein